MNSNTLIGLFGISTKTIFVLSTILILFAYSACRVSTKKTLYLLEVPKTPAEQPQIYTVSFNTNGGGKISSQNINSGDTVAKPDNPTRAAFIFGNWFMDKALTEIYAFSAPVTSDLTLYASWISEDATIYKVAFNTEGGNNLDTQRIEDGKFANRPPDPTRADYRFVDWYSNSFFSGRPYDFGTAVTANITLHANWIEVFKVTFNTRGGNNLGTQRIEDGKFATRPPDPTRANYRFVDWYSNSFFSGQPYDFGTAVTANITLHANWMRVFNVTFDMNTGTFARTSTNESGETPPTLEIPPALVDSNATVAKPNPILIREGHRLANWYSNSSFSGQPYDFGTAVTANITLYANWIEVYTITFNSNGGSEVGLTTVDVSAARQIVQRPTNPTNTENGGTFVGWFTDNGTFNNAYVFNARTSEAVPITEDIALYAKWDYMVTYDERTGAITGLNSNLPDGNVQLVIPSNINGLTVDSIRHGAFRNNTRIVSLRIIEGVRYIGDTAFQGCTGLEGILTIPSSIVTIGESAFEGCRGFTDRLIIPSSVETIGDRAFGNMTGIASFNFKKSTPPNTIGTEIFFNIRNLNIIVPKDALRVYRTVPNLQTYNRLGIITEAP